MMKNKILIKQQHNFMKMLFTGAVEAIQVIGTTTVIMAAFSILIGDIAPIDAMMYLSLVQLLVFTPIYVFMNIRSNEKKEKLHNTGVYSILKRRS